MRRHSDDEYADDPPVCDLKWSASCDNRGVEHVDPEWACHACAAVCELCQEHEWAVQVALPSGLVKVCEGCLVADKAIA